MQAAFTVPRAIAVRGVFNVEAASLMEEAPIGTMPYSEHRIQVGPELVVIEAVGGPARRPTFAMDEHDRDKFSQYSEDEKVHCDQSQYVERGPEHGTPHRWVRANGNRFAHLPSDPQNS